jgi:putative FmdB family regulatory protein
MPIYEYRCKKCGEQIEVIQKFSDRPLRTCRSCKGRLEKLISRSSFSLKGGGWYAEGYTGSKASRSTSGSAESTSGGSGGGSKSASKSDSKSPAKTASAS